MNSAALFSGIFGPELALKRLSPGSAWVGVELTREFGWWHEALLFPTPAAADGDCASEHYYRGPRNPTLLGAARQRGLFPTPVARDWKGTGLEGQLGTVAWRGLWPAPKASAANYGRPRPKNWGDIQAAVLRAEGNPPKGMLNPDWVEWLMGFPVGWTNLEQDRVAGHRWDFEPVGIPRVGEGTPKRKQRLTCIGNALVPQVMHWVAKRALERLP